jgi:hypothetical protein
MSAILDFDAQERRQIDAALAQRFGHAPGLEPADSELRLDPGTPVLTSCPTLYWGVNDCHFLLFKTGERRYRCQFFYTEKEHYGAGALEFGDLRECITALLRAQADQDKERKGVRSGLTGERIGD